MGALGFCVFLIFTVEVPYGFLRPSHNYDHHEKYRKADDFSSKYNPFVSLVNSKYYVDKTYFIERFHVLTTPVYLTARRGFGKTVNLSMLKAFYEMRINRNGTIIQNEDTDNYKAFLKLQHNRDYKSVTHTGNFSKFFFSTYPVVHLSFQKLNIENYKLFTNSLSHLLAEIYEMHKYLKTCEKCSSDERKMFEKVISAEATDITLLARAGSALTKMLYRQFTKPCLLLIDDFDVPITKIITNGSSDATKIIQMLTTFVAHLIQHSQTVEKALLVGASRLAQIYAPSLGGIKHYSSILNEDYAPFFGFSEMEVRRLISNDEDFREMTYFSGGYQTPNSIAEIFHPASVIKFIETRSAQDEIWEIKKLEPLLKVEVVRKGIEKAIWGQLILNKVPSEPEYQRTIDSLRKIFKHISDNTALELTEFDLLSLWHYLFELGYLTADSKEAGTQLRLRVPNQGIQTTLVGYLTQFWLNRLGTTEKTVKSYIMSLMKLNHKNSSFESLAESVTELFSTTQFRPKSEEDLRAPLYIFLVSSPKQFPVLEVRSSGNEATDDTAIEIMQQREFHTRKGVIIEFQYHNCSNGHVIRRLTRKSYWDIFGCQEDAADILRFIIIGICLNEKSQLEFTFLYASRRNENAYHVIKNISQKRFVSRS